ncbi:TauD/TfdA family dioxygenase [Streptomyces sp. NPDC002952]|uniref:TauD/TfdA family dioxygenase n=1 Tax=Streptomyces sp. NPDC002952 TaxID=3364673 RepID=UPI0036ABC0FB
MQWSLAAAALESLPELPSQLAAIRAGLLDEGYVVADVPGLAVLNEQRRDAAVVALSSLMGTPTPVGGATTQIVWSVRPRPELPDKLRAVNFSIAWGEACLHTDSAIIPDPERWFGLWCMQPAADGGASILVDVERVIAALRADTAGRDALALLREARLPMWNGQDDLHWVRLLDGPRKCAVRYGADLFAEGIQRAGLGADDPRVIALRTFERVLAVPLHRIRIPLKTDQVVFVDNHRVMHAREHFTDVDRCLLRVRLNEPPVCAPITGG